MFVKRHITIKREICGYISSVIALYCQSVYTLKSHRKEYEDRENANTLIIQIYVTINVSLSH